MCVCGTSERTITSICFILSWGEDGVLLTFEFVGSFYLVLWIVSHGFKSSWDDAGTHSIFETAGGKEPMIVCPGQRRPDNIGVKTYLQIPIFCHGLWLTREPPCRLQLSGLSHVRLSQSVWNFSFSFIQTEHDVVRVLEYLAGPDTMGIILFNYFLDLRRLLHCSSMVFRLLPLPDLFYTLRPALSHLIGIQFPLDHFIDPFSNLVCVWVVLLRCCTPSCLLFVSSFPPEFATLSRDPCAPASAHADSRGKLRGNGHGSVLLLFV